MGKENHFKYASYLKEYGNRKSVWAWAAENMQRISLYSGLVRVQKKNIINYILSLG